MIPCAECGASFNRPASHMAKRNFCSMKCRNTNFQEYKRGSNNSNWRNLDRMVECAKCLKPFDAGYQYKTRKFCSQKCYFEGGMRSRSKKDSNHHLIVEAIDKAGGCSLDLSILGKGVPDLVVNTKRGVVFAEVKNPKTFYGRSGLSKLQLKWADDWRGTPVFILSTIEDAIRLVQGKFDTVVAEGGRFVFANGAWKSTDANLTKL